jgi:hypothetical protein
LFSNILSYLRRIKMAGFSRVNGDAGAVFVFDTGATGVNGSAVGTGVTINPHGPALDYFAIDFGGNISNTQFQSGGAVEAVNRTIQQLTTIATYEIQADQTVSTARSSKYAVYPKGGTTASALQFAIQGLNIVNGHDLSGATVVATTFGA